MNSESSIPQRRSLVDWLGNIIALLLTIAVNALANILPLAGVTTGYVSALYPSLFTPAGYTFAIWSFIYLALSAFAVYQALPAQRHDERLARLSTWFKLSCAANCAWILLWHYQLIPFTLLAMIVLLGSLVQIYKQLGASDGLVGRGERFLLHVPFSVYLGWITVATIANVSAVQTAFDWNSVGLSAVAWTIVKLALAGLIATAVSRRYRDGVYALVFVWAAVGIAVAQADTKSVFVAALALAVYCIVLAVRLLRTS